MRDDFLVFLCSFIGCDVSLSWDVFVGKDYEYSLLILLMSWLLVFFSCDILVFLIFYRKELVLVFRKVLNGFNWNFLG